MPSFSTPALVLRRSDYSDSDRMVTLFTPERGRIDAIARGCRRPKSPLMNCCEPFVSGEFQLYQRGERVAIEQCQISESCFELRSDYDRLRHGAYWLRLLDACVMPDAPMPELFLIALRALAHLNYSELPPELLTMAFEMHLMKQLGLAPRVDVCLICGRPIDGDARFDASRGGCVCLNCAPDPPTLATIPPGGAKLPTERPPKTSSRPASSSQSAPDFSARQVPGFGLAEISPRPTSPARFDPCAGPDSAEVSPRPASPARPVTGFGSTEASPRPASPARPGSDAGPGSAGVSPRPASPARPGAGFGSAVASPRPAFPARQVPGQSCWLAPRISNGARRILLKLPRTRYEQVKLLDGHPDWPEAARLFRPYVELHVSAQKFAPPLYEPR